MMVPMNNTDILFRRAPTLFHPHQHLFYLKITKLGFENLCYPTQNKRIIINSGKIRFIPNNEITRIQPFQYVLFHKYKNPNGLQVLTKDHSICLLLSGYFRQDYYKILNALQISNRSNWINLFHSKILNNEEFDIWQDSTSKL